MKSGKSTMLILSISVIFLGIASVLLVGSISRQSVLYAFFKEADIDIAAAKSAYEISGSNTDLYHLIFGMCHQVATSQADDAQLAEFKKLGSELYNRAKNRTLDLETISDPDITTHMLELLNIYGVSPRN